jgi:ATP-dependent DNA helicase RecQ
MATLSESPNRRRSAGFYDNECTFNIRHLPKVEKPLPVSVSVAEKMLLRGLPTKPSHYLRQALEKHYPGKSPDNTDAPYFISASEPIWNKTILGDPDKPEYNPAKGFYNALIPKFLPDYSFIRQLIQPECPFGRFIVDHKPEENIPQRAKADFFLDAGDLSIEVDGFSHNKEDQQLSDKDRDLCLKRRGIDTLRITTHELKTLDKSFIDKMNDLTVRLENTSDIQAYKQAFDKKFFLEERYEYTITAIIRFQILLIELMRTGVLDPFDKTWELNLQTDVIASFNWAELAFDDLFEWSLPVLEMYGKSIVKPEFKLNLKPIGKTSSLTKAKGIFVDFRLFERWLEDDLTDTIQVRSDYINKARWLFDGNRPTIRIRDYSEIKQFSIKNRPTKSKSMMRSALEKFNLQLFGFKSFKDGQFEIIANILSEKHTLGLLPTGGGKSLCFHLSASFYGGCCIVVCPIVALMRDQVQELTQMGFKGRVFEISGSQSSAEKNLFKKQISDKRLQFAFVSPERFQNEDFRNILSELHEKKLIGSIVVDEVHCLSEWGHDFRTSYLTLASTIRKIAPDVPISCLTATASINVLKDIQFEFNIPNGDVVYRMDNGRKELGFRVVNPAQRDELEFKVLDLGGKKIGNKKFVEAEAKSTATFKLLERLAQKGWVNKDAAGLIFTPHVNGEFGCYDLRKDIKKKFPRIYSGFFCGDVPKAFKEEQSKRKENKKSYLDFDTVKKDFQESFKRDELDLMCVTKSFGMGINKPNIRFTIHYSIPESLEALYQEGGRAGRDGEKAECYVLFTREHQDIPDWVHSPDTDIEELLKFTKGWNNGDFKLQLYMNVNNVNKIEDDLRICMRVWDEIDRIGHMGCVISRSEVKKDLPNLRFDRISIEKALYRLYQLGIVTDWTVKDFYQHIFKASTQKQTPEQTASTLKKFIERYEKNSTQRLNSTKAISDILANSSSREFRTKILTFLLRWNYDNFVYNRRQSLKNLYEACMGYEVDGADKFKKRLDEYFRLDELTSDLSFLIEADARRSVKIMESRFISDGNLVAQTKVERVQFSLARYLESNKNNPGLDLMSGMCRLLNDDFEDTDGAPRLQNFIKLAQNDKEIWSEAFPPLLEFVAILPAKKKELFSYEVCPLLESSEDLAMVHYHLGDDFSAMSYLDKFNERLEKVI